MRVLIAGATGLIGSELTRFLTSNGHQVIRLVRNKDQVSSNAVFWDPEHGHLDVEVMSNVDGVINLSGENLASSRWNEDKKRRIIESRLNATRTLVKAMTELANPPKVFISGSAIGFYGDRGIEVCTEATNNGEGFLSNVCQEWERAAATASKRGIRTILLRTGVVFTPKGGALAKMVPPFKFGLGGRLGSGRQYVSWIAIDDLVRIILFILEHPHIDGPVNAVAPNPVTNSQLTKALGKVLHRPAVFPVPAFILHLLLGREMADEFLLSSTRVIPLQLQNGGFRFKLPELEQALRSWYGREKHSQER